MTLVTTGDLLKLCDLRKIRLGLESWKIDFRVEDCESENSYMEIQRGPYCERAVIFVQPWSLDGALPDAVMDAVPTSKVIEEILVHELLHCHTTGLRSVLYDDLEGQLHRDVETVAFSAFKREEERLVNKLAVALVAVFADG
jgi:hypothetical protein